MGRLLLLACALTPPAVGSFVLVPPSGSSPSCRRSAFHPSAVSTNPLGSTASRIGVYSRRRHRTPLTSSYTSGHNNHRLRRIPSAGAGAAVHAMAPGPGCRRHRFSKQYLARRSFLSDLDNGNSADDGDEEELSVGSGTSTLSSPLDESPQDPGGRDETLPSEPPPLPSTYTYGDAEAKADAALRKLSPSELAGMKSRLGLDESLESEEEILAGAVPILADKIRARAAAEEVPSTPLSSASLRSPAEQASGGSAAQDNWAGGASSGSGVGKDWVVEKGSRRWVGAPGEKPPRQRHVNREPEPPLAPGQRSYFATCPRGLETVLRDELLSPLIGATLVKSSGRGCHFRGDQAVGYKAILWLRTAHRVLELVGEGGTPLGDPIDGAESLYRAAADVDWSRFMRHGQTLSVDAILGVVPDGLMHSHFTALTVKNAVVDQLRDSGNGQRPSVDTENPDLPLVVYLDRGRALLYRSLSGTRSMHKRGYRDAMHAASLKENVAAGLLLASGWDPETQALADPMCGSGTLVIEAALIALRRAPGLVAMGAYRGSNNGGGWSKEAGWEPAVTAWPDFDPVLWRETVGEALRLQRAKTPAAIMGNDWHHGALSLAWRDAKAAGVEQTITLFDEDVGRWRPPSFVDLAVTNPPWDFRLDQGAEQSWRGLLKFLRREVAEKDAWVLSGNPALSRVLRMKSEQNMYLATGGVELRWLKYHLNEYRGDSGKRGGGRGGRRPKKVSRMHDRPAVDRW
eukprot:g13040.t1